MTTEQARNQTKFEYIPNDQAESSPAPCSVPYLWRDDGERFSRNEDGTYTMDSNREAQPTCYYRYTFARLMNTGVFSVELKPTPRGGYYYK